ncbi:A disintegrin and metalloproteinase with thrombospondin motifs 16-like [Centruroides vittatus]|uniref:A disintegrin and metalloproteinase with thrombospondin motifs 16-like n=1 Tax=Centruroides vittatus TaxID=120091 RepID=UPI00350EACC0
MKSQIFTLVFIFQVLQGRNSFVIEDESEISTETVYPLIHHMPMNEGDTSYAAHEKLIIIKTLKTTFYVELLPNYELISEDIKDVHGLACLFQGRILSHKGGMAAISTCHGEGRLHGILMTPEENYFINPHSSTDMNFEFLLNNKSSFPHALSKSSQNFTKFCGTHDADFSFFKQQNKDTKNEMSNEHLKRTSNKIPTIEAAVFIDQVLEDRYNSLSLNSFHIVLSILNQVQLIFKYRSLSTPLNFVLIRYGVIKNQTEIVKNDIDYFNEFCNWQRILKKKEIKWDIAILLTGAKLISDKSGRMEMIIDKSGRKHKTVGMAKGSSMCKENSCAFSDGKRFDAGLILAHEIGHSLSMAHDGIGNSCDSEKNIMSPSVGAGKTTWSTCSNSYLEDFLKTPQASCLYENISSKQYNLTLDNKLPGEKYPPDVQCKLFYGKQYRAYYGKSKNICHLLPCLAPNGKINSSHPALDGSQCHTNKVCYEGNCILKRKFPRRYNFLEENFVE